MVQAVQLMPACRAWRKVGRPVATMVPSREDINRAIETMAKISQGDVAASVVELGRHGLPSTRARRGWRAAGDVSPAFAAPTVPGARPPPAGREGDQRRLRRGSAQGHKTLVKYVRSRSTLANATLHRRPCQPSSVDRRPDATRLRRSQVEPSKSKRTSP